MSKPEDYLAIRVWHERTGSFEYYIKRMQEKAAQEDAPLDALYFSDEDGWVRMQDLHVDHWIHRFVANASR